MDNYVDVRSLPANQQQQILSWAIQFTQTQSDNENAAAFNTVADTEATTEYVAETEVIPPAPSMPQSIETPVASSSTTFETPFELVEEAMEENEIEDAITHSIFEEGATFDLNPLKETRKSGGLV